ncbi:MAG: hypothetical protein VX527_13105 [Planctomycetota bacterium]|nr:hypothetical protein [Planctomycetota bacterium]
MIMTWILLSSLFLGGGECPLTRPDIEGPYWLPGSPERSNLREEGDVPLLDLSGVVLGNDCVPIPGAWIDIWHADPEGDYDKGGWGYRGHFYADSEAGYLLETVVPGLYPGRTSHIHVKVQGNTNDVFTTQLYFPDLPENDSDFFYHPDLEVTVESEDSDGNMVATFVFVLDEPGTVPCPGDLDEDGEINVNDVLILLGAWPGAGGDVDGDGDTDVNDLLAMLAVYGQSCGSAAH